MCIVFFRAKVDVEHGATVEVVYCMVQIEPGATVKVEYGATVEAVVCIVIFNIFLSFS
jgi:hypothetical protein